MIFRFLLTIAILVCGVLGSPAEDEGEKPPPIRALLVTGGSSHDYAERSRILTAGIRQRSNRVIEWRIVHQGEGRSDVAIPLFSEERWEEDYDVVVHDYCFTRVYDRQYAEKILAPHRAGTPAVLIHAAMLSFPIKESEDWFRFCGAEVTGHGGRDPYTVGWKAPADPISSGLPALAVPGGQLYRVKSLLGNSKVLGEAADTEGRIQPVAWRHLYGPSNAKVFATTLGNDEATFLEPAFLDLLTRGLLWAVDGLDDSAFKVVAPEDSLPGFHITDSVEPKLRPGLSMGRSVEVTALASDIASGHLPESAFDGNPSTYWEAESVGPATISAEWQRSRPIVGAVIEWKDDVPTEYLLEGRLETGEWIGIGGKETRFGDATTYQRTGSDEHFFGLRLSVPATDEGVVVGVRELVGYSTPLDVPAAFLVEEKHDTGFRALGEEPESREVLLANGWTLETITEIPDAFELRCAIPTSSGLMFLVGNYPGASHDTILSALPSDSDEPYYFHEFLPRVARGSSAIWDGEWLRVLEGVELTAFRDTNGDGVADEKSGRVRVFEISKPEGPEPEISSLRLTPDGWCYGLIVDSDPWEGLNRSGQKITTPRSGIVRFRLDGDEFSTVWSSREIAEDFVIDAVRRISVAVRAQQGQITWQTLFDLPGAYPGMEIEWVPAPQEGSRPGLMRFVRGSEVGRELRIPGGSMVQKVVDFRDLPVLLSTIPEREECFVRWASGWRIHRLTDGQKALPRINLDRMPDDRIVPLFSSPARAIRDESGYELLRRKRDLTSEIFSLFAKPDSRSYRSALAVSARLPGRSGFAPIEREVEDRGNTYALRLFGDRKEAVNHPVFARLAEETTPAVSAGLLAAIQKSGTNFEGLEELALSLATHPDRQLASTSKNFLIMREALDICFHALDDPEREDLHPVAFEILATSSSHEASVGIISRLEQTRDPIFRRRGQNALCRMYQLGPERLDWEATRSIGAFLEASLKNRRVDTAYLLDQMHTWNVPVGSSVAIAEIGRENLSLESGAISILIDRDGVPAIAVPWLEEILEDESRDESLRVDAAALLVRNSITTYREKFEIASQALELEARRRTYESLIKSWSEVDSTAEVDWLLDRVGSNGSADRLAAWIALFSVLGESPAGVDAGKIRSKANDVAKSGGDSLGDLIAAQAAAGYSADGSWLVTASDSADEEVRRVAREAADTLGIDPVTGGARGSAIGAIPLEQALEEVEQAHSAADPEAGWHVFERERCAVCHNIHREGLSFGPDIIAAVGEMSGDHFVKALLSPESSTGPGYGSRIFELTNGHRLRGIVEEREDSAIRLRDSAGNIVKLPKERIGYEWEETRSPVHRDFGASLSPLDVASLRLFLRKVGGN